MIRTMMTMFALGTLTIGSASAMAATKIQTRAHHQNVKTPVVATAEGSAPAAATDEAKPTTDAKPAKAHKGHKAKGSAKAKDAPAGETTGSPAPEAPQK